MEYIIGVDGGGSKTQARNDLYLISKLNFNNEVAIGIKGSILTKVRLVKSSFEENLKSKIGSFTLVDEEVSPAKGAFYLAKKLLEI